MIVIEKETETITLFPKKETKPSLLFKRSTGKQKYPDKKNTSYRDKGKVNDQTSYSFIVIVCPSLIVFFIVFFPLTIVTTNLLPARFTCISKSAPKART